jgi:serine/threonine protein kinase
VESLLAALERAGDFLRQPAAAPGATGDLEPGADPAEPGASAPGGTPPAHAGGAPEEVGSRIGPYKLLQRLGEGGMGAVWVAEQTEPVKRRVALKLIKPGLDSAPVLRRFEAERQALALMDHPHIAKVLDAGTTAAGRPYFVMELVKGVPLTRYCDELHLPIRERLALFVPVCQAVQHAHTKGIIHRDLKPSNVLVCIQDGRPAAKVIDFGVAKALHHKLAEQSLYTEIGQVVGTLEYMSPEQAELSALDIDTRADVYGLGVLLYELLTGTTPLHRKRLRGAAVLELLRIIREEEPPKPSTRLSDSKDSLPSLAAQRRTETGRLAREVRGELDWIVMRCLEKDRTRRYETADGLARDVQRYLADEVVEARPPSTRYRLHKFVRRNQGRVVAAALVLLALVGGLIGTTLGLLEARRQRDGAEQARRDEAVQREKADAERARAVAERDEKEKARVAAAEQRRLAQANEQKAKEERDRAEREKRSAEAVRSFLQQDLLRQADAASQADSLRLAGAGAGAVENPTIRELLDRAARGLTAEKIEAKFPRQPLVQAEILETVGHTYLGVGDYAKAIRHLQRAADLRRTHLGPDHADTLATLNNLALAYRDAGKTAAAIALLEQVRDANITKLGPDHPDTLATLNNLAGAYRSAGKTAAAIALYEKVRDASIAKLGPDHPHTLTTLNNLANAYQAAGKTAAAIALLEQVRDARIAKLGPDHPHTLTTLNNLAFAYQDAGRTAEAIALWEPMLPKARRVFGASHPSTIAFTNNLLSALEQTSRFARASELGAELLAVLRQQLPPDDPRLAGTLAQHGLTLLKAGKPADAEPTLRECLAIRAKKEPDAWVTFNTRSLLGGSLLGQKKYADAEPLLLAGYEGMKQREAKIPPQGKVRLTEALERLVQLYDAWGQKDEADGWRKKLEEAKASAGKERPKREPARNELAPNRLPVVK